ncbi:type III secretion system inner membrane ring subunit SctD [Bordetella genomosp. 9]|nr:type III secretion system inner membrane ring subunit SctD [Bordetella genomosp. 9]
MTLDLELRVLTGLHQGAKCQAHDGALIGSDGRCDIVLCDEGIPREAARLSLGPAAWGMRPPSDPRGPEDAVESGDTPYPASDRSDTTFGMPLALGPVLLTVAHPSTPWPAPGQLIAVPHAVQNPAPESNAETDTAPGAEVLVGAPLEPATQAYAALGVPTYRRPRAAGLRWAVGGLLVLLVFGSVASFPPSKAPSNAQARTGRPLEPETLRRAQALLAERGYAPRVQARANEYQEVVITGWVQDETEHDSLATALSTIWPLPAMRVATETQIAERLRTLMLDMDISAGIGRLPAGDLEIRGVAGTDQVRQEAYRRWRDDGEASAFPITISLSLATEAAGAFREAVAMAGLPAMASTWKDKALHIKPGVLDVSQRERLNAIQDALNPRYMGAIRIDSDPGQADASFPFRVRTVVGGGQPWVVLEDGTRIAVGGTHGAYRLTSIDDGSVVFDGPSPTIITR